MVKTCKQCKVRVQKQHGKCINCLKQTKKEHKKELDEYEQEKKGIYKHTLKNWVIK